LPIIGRERFIAGYSLEDVKEGKVPAILYPPSFIFQAGQPDEITQSYRRAMGMDGLVEASRGFVQMDELMDGVGKRLAEISGAEWGIITSGCCAAITNCVCASIAGSNPERMQRLPMPARSASPCGTPLPGRAGHQFVAHTYHRHQA
jgi:hypothetical protein